MPHDRRRPEAGEPVGIQPQGGEHREMSVDRVGLALPAAGLAVGLLRLDDREAGGRDRAGQSDTVAARALHRHHRPRPRRTVDDPGQQLRKPELSLLIFRVPIGVPVGRAISSP